MALLVFWLKIAVKETISLFKTSPIVIIGAMVLIAAFLAGGRDAVLTLNREMFIITVSTIVLIALILSAKKYDVLSMLTLYAKSGYSNRHIHGMFFLKQALINNALLFVFDFIVLKGIIQTEYALYLPMVTVVSVLCLYACMFLRHKHGNTKIMAAGNKSIRVNPLIKSALYDYCTPGFIQEALLSSALFIVVVVHETEYTPAFFMGLLLVLTLGLMGILDSIPQVNWQFYAIVSSNNFKRHYRRAFLFLIGFFCPLIVSFVCMGLRFDPYSLIKYCCIMLALVLFSITISFLLSHMLIKCFALVIAAFLTLWICSIHAYLLVLSIIPLGVTFLKAKNEHREWYLL
jgi:hypothetical protein